MATRDPIRGLPGVRISRRVLLASAAVIALALASVGGYNLIQEWRVERELRAAKVSLQQRDNNNALLNLRKALLVRPGHIEARRALASLLEELTSAEAIGHRRKLVELQPDLLEPRLELVETALRFGDTSEASRTLKMITGPQRKMPRVMELQAQAYVAQGRPELAVEVYRELVEQRPEDRGAKIKLTALELQDGPELDRAAARANLESLVTDDEFGLLALRALASEALDNGDSPGALAWSKRACEMPLAEFSDRLVHLQALYAARSDAFERWLTDVEKIAVENPSTALKLAKWKANALGPGSAAALLESLPTSIRENAEVSLLLADCYSALKRWDDLESLVVAASWSEFDPIRLALLARAQTGQGSVRQAERTWQEALEAAERNPRQLSSLVAIAKADKRDVRQVLWMTAEHDPQNLLVRQELYQAYWQERNADGMLRMMELVLKEKPNDRAAKYAVASLLFATGRQIDRARRLAGELYEVDPLNLGNAVLYGFGLHLQGKSKMAADLLAARDDLDKLGNDGRTYYSLILSGCDRNEEARRVLSNVDPDALLPELRASLDRTFGTVPKNAVTQQPD